MGNALLQRLCLEADFRCQMEELIGGIVGLAPLLLGGVEPIVIRPEGTLLMSGAASRDRSLKGMSMGGQRIVEKDISDRVLGHHFIANLLGYWQKSLAGPALVATELSDSHRRVF